MFYGMCVVDYPVLKLTRIAVDSMLDDKRIFIIANFGQVLEKWANILCPEYKAIHLLR